MHKRFVLIAFALALFLLGCSTASQSSPASSESEAKSSSLDFSSLKPDENSEAASTEKGTKANNAPLQATTNPFLWKMEGPTPQYFFGTIHIPEDAVLDYPPSVAAALDQAQAVYTELPMDALSQMSVLSETMLPPGKTLKELLGDDLYKRLDARFDKLLIDMPGAARSAVKAATFGMKPWAIAAQMELLKYLPQLAEGKQVLDQKIYFTAQEAGKTVGGLETAEEQLAVFDSMTMEDQITMLRDTLDMMDKYEKEGKNAGDELTRAYLSGEEEQVKEKMTEYEGQNKELYTKLMERLLDKRNVIMADRIDAMLKAQPTTIHMFAVGAAHYPGDKGILTLLKAKGYKISRVAKAE